MSTHDITGGNSGSPVFNRELEIVGTIFDSNIQGISNNHVFSEEVARAVSVDSRGMLEALRKIYGMDAVVEELLGSAGKED